MKNGKKVWFITGVSRGLGRLIATAALAKGDFVIGTTRDGKSDIQSLPGRLHVLPLDVTDRQQVHEIVDKAFAIHWRIDVLVNNAGYGLLGAIEEIEPDAAKKQFDTNFFGPLNVIQAVLPTMRAQGRGHILNISSVAGIDGSLAGGLYAASKFALEGLSESLAREIEPFNLKVTIVEPGAFKTDFLSDRSIKIAAPSDAYPEIEQAINRYNSLHGQQSGDPARAAQAIVDLTDEENPPLRLVLGPDAYERITTKIARLTDELSKYEKVSFSTDFASVG